MRCSSPTSNSVMEVSARRQRPPASTPGVRKRMQATGRRDTPTELRIRSLLHRMGWRFRVDIRPSAATRSRADIVFSKVKVAVYIDGCFWHGCPVHRTWPKSNAAWWREKIETNCRRDRDATATLKAADWAVVRVWEHDDPRTAVDVIVAALRSASLATGKAGPRHRSAVPRVSK
jgi:DNA mismatch endonuclease, patch repair protein